MNEHDLTDQVKRWLRRQPHVFFFKVHGSKWQRRGLPDIIACVKKPRVKYDEKGFTIDWSAWAPGVFVAIELKHPEGKGKLSEVQIEVQTEIVRAGGHYRVCRSMMEVEEFLREVIEP